MRTKSPNSPARPKHGGGRRHGRGSGLKSGAAVGFAVLLVLALQAQTVQAQDTQRATVALASAPSVDPCPDRGEVRGLNPQGDGFLAVRTGPSTDYEQVDELHNGDMVKLCDYRNGWHRVVYTADDSRVARCRLSSDQLPDPKSAGPCRSGWVHGNWVRWIWE